ncbi:MAG: hypothetical protein IPK87_16115 [Planctomycetes bacterium]|nr:hypothetical protein [Planctomycetota bacterium]
MADAISFTCPDCSKAYKVAGEYAGRQFACKQCGNQLTVPAIFAEPQVEMGSGTAVMRKTDSGRVVQVVAPTQAFSQQRETTITAAQQARKKSPLPVLVGVGAVVLVAVVLVTALALGAFSSSVGDGQDHPAGPIGANQSAQDPDVPKVSRRDDIMNRLNTPGLALRDFLSLFRQAQEAKLDSADLSLLAEAVVKAAWDEQGGELSDADLMALALELKGMRNDVPTDTLRRTVVERYRGKKDKPEVWAQAQGLLGRQFYDFGPQVTRATGLHDSGVLTGADVLANELRDIESKSDEGWVLKPQLERLQQIATSLDELAAELARIARDEPFRLVAAQVQREVSAERFHARGKWLMDVAEPLIVFAEVGRRSSESETRPEAERARQSAAALLEWYRANVATPLELTRSLPAGIESQSERDKAPIVLVLFATQDSWRAYLSDLRATIDTARNKTFIDHTRGRLSGVIPADQSDTNDLLHGLARLAVDLWHPKAPRELDEKAEFRRATTYFLSRYFAACISKADDSFAPRDFMQDTGDHRRFLARWIKPFEQDAVNRGVNSFGGPAATVKDLVGMKDSADFPDIFEKHIAGYSWPEEVAKSTVNSLRTDSRTLALVMQQYCIGLIMFLYHHEAGGKPVYREKLLKYFKADIDGTVTKDNQLEIFTKTFALDEAGWTELEAQYRKYQEGP